MLACWGSEVKGERGQRGSAGRCCMNPLVNPPSRGSLGFHWTPRLPRNPFDNNDDLLSDFLCSLCSSWLCSSICHWLSLTVVSSANAGEHIIVCSEHCVLEETPGEAEGGSLMLTPAWRPMLLLSPCSWPLKFLPVPLLWLWFWCRLNVHLDVNASHGSTSLPTGSVQPHRPGFPPSRVGGGAGVHSESGAPQPGQPSWALLRDQR